MTTSMPFLSMRKVSKRYVGVQALDSVDFSIERGEIHCLVGENGSGKSTLIKIISGVEQPDEGASIEVDGEQFQDFHAIHAMRKGIEVIYQDLSLFPNLGVAENIALNQMVAGRKRYIKWSEVSAIARRAMDRIGVNLPLDELVGDLSIADQQLVAICRALTRDVKLVIMDEPTASLTQKEVDSLLAVVSDMKAKGIATMFVSHKLNEVMAIAERVTILRDGRKMGTFPSTEVDDERLGELMTGARVEQTRYQGQPSSAQPLVEVRNLSKQGYFEDVNFVLRPGEILGITGLLGSGRTDLALALFGISPADSGEIVIDSKPVTIGSVEDAIQAGIGFVPEDRLAQGLIMEQSVGKNIVVTVLDRLLGRWGLIDTDKAEGAAAEWVKNLAIRVPSVDSPVLTLSGGNQQRVVLAKWIATDPKILILDGPTIGIDVAAKSAIHAIIRRLAGQGIAIIVISDEVPEVYHNCNRVFVMHKGRFVAEFDPAQATIDEIQMCIDGANEVKA